MVKVEESKGKLGEGFQRIFGNAEIAVLFSKVQSAVIRSGFELEKILENEVPEQMITTLNDLEMVVLNATEMPPVQVVFKPARFDPDNPKKSVEADLLVVDNIQRLFRVIEVKEGYVFDTKKSDGELASLRKITSWLAQEFPYRAQYYLCSFNQEDKEEIIRGAKGRFSIDHVLTGRELSAMINIDYDQICESRRIDQLQNRRYFLKQLLSISSLRQEIDQILDEMTSK